jgi:hypothetical protein
MGLSLKLLLALASEVTLRSESRATHDQILLSPIQDCQTWRARSPYLHPPWTGCPGYTPRYYFPFSSPPTTRGATVDLSDPASTRGDWHTFPVGPRYIASARTAQTYRFLYYCVLILFAETCLSRRCLAIIASSCHTIPVFNGHVTIWITMSLNFKNESRPWTCLLTLVQWRLN